MTLRLLTKSDLTQFKELRLQGLQETPKSYIHIYAQEAQKPDDYHIGLIENNNIVGAFNNEELMGFAFMSFYGSFKQRHKCMVWGAFVKPEYRGQSIGKNMRLFLFEEARKLNMTHCISSIAADNPASLAMHIGVGYEIMYKEQNGLKHRDDTFSDIIHLIKKL